MSGTVHVDQRKPFAATSLKLQLVGTEYTHVVDEEGKRTIERNTNVMVSYEEVVLLDLTPFNNESKIGTYDFPFTIQIPFNLRPTFFKPLS